MSFISADQLLAHALGDYVLQSDWMANRKTKSSVAAAVHALTYSFVFALAFKPSPSAWALIASSHFVIDRWRVARFVVWLKNFLAPHWTKQRRGSFPERWWFTWAECKATGYPPDRPAWLAVWLLIIVDNVLHVAINGAALRWL